MMVKMKFEDEDFATDRELCIGHAHLQENSITDVGLCIKEENNIAMKIENGRESVTIKQELDIGPTLLQPKTVPHPLSPLTVVSSQAGCDITSIPQCELQQKHLHSQISPAILRSSSGSANDAATAPLCLVPVQPEGAPYAEVEDYHCMKNSGILADSDFVLHLSREEDVYHRVLSGQTYDSSGSEGTSVDRQERGQCGYCVEASTESSYTTNLNLIKHTNITPIHVWRNPFKSKQYRCSSSRAGSLKIHAHMSEAPYRCKHCKFSTFYPANLKRHVRIHTGEKPYRCEQCEYSASQLAHLKQHMCIHSGDRPYKCEECAYSASKPGDLKLHIRIHTGEKPYKCEECEYSASQISSLKAHVRTHTGEKPYRCELCEYSASLLGPLKKHMHTHTGEKPYKCENCEYSTSLLGHLKKHMRTHTGEKPYKCELCEYSASRRDSLKRHMRIHT